MAHQESPRPFFDPLINRLIRDSARRVIACANLPHAELPDIEQDLRLHLWSTRDAYQAERGARSTFAKVVLQRKAAAIAMRHRAKRRVATHVSIDDDLDTKHGNGEQPVGKPSPGVRASTGSTDSLNRRIDVHRVLERLSRPDRAMAKQLMAARVSEIAATSGIPRSTIYESVKRIRRQFIDAGLDPRQRAAPTFLRSIE